MVRPYRVPDPYSSLRSLHRRRCLSHFRLHEAGRRLQALAGQGADRSRRRTKIRDTDKTGDVVEREHQHQRIKRRSQIINPDQRAQGYWDDLR